MDSAPENIARAFLQALMNIFYAGRDLSLDAPIARDGDRTSGTLIDHATHVDDKNPDNDQLSRLRLKHKLLSELFETARLSPAEKEIVLLRFGVRLDLETEIDPDAAGLTLQAIGNKLHYSREEVRRIGAKGLKKLRTALRRYRAKHNLGSHDLFSE